ncbi:MAG: hypothetical protein KAX78_12205, partial [Phycisphaerae bacterium]|nr:hypothetical protein [Phycisphaerae bacterium]
TGPPKVTVFVSWSNMRDQSGAEDVQKRIESQLTKEGCQVVPRVFHLPTTDGPLVSVAEVMVSDARTQGVHFLVVGDAGTESGGPTEAAGRTFQSCKATASVGLLRVDTGELLCNISIKPTTGIKPTAAAAAKQAMWIAAKTIGIKVRSEVLARWADVLAAPTTQPAPATRPAGRIRTRRGE